MCNIINNVFSFLDKIMFCEIKNSELYIWELRFYSWLFGRKALVQQYNLHKIKGFHNCLFAWAISNALELYLHGESDVKMIVYKILKNGRPYSVSESFTHTKHKRYKTKNHFLRSWWCLILPYFHLSKGELEDVHWWKN